MNVRAKDARKGPAEAAAASRPAWLDRMNAFGERHARSIVIASSYVPPTWRAGYEGRYGPIAAVFRPEEARFG